ncbi:MAG: cell division protein ZapA [Flavobacteriales bacterium]|nr:cell division protein ZapA [Flavobacteriales bacterium]
MSEISIKVQIGTRTYPLSVNPGEEELIRAAAQEVNDNIRMLQENYAVKDIQDLLAMTALQLATQLRNKKGENVPADQSELQEVNRMLDAYLERL